MLIRCAPFSRTIYGFVPFARTFALKKPLLYASRLFEESECEKLKIEITAQKWDLYETKMLRVLGIAHQEAPSCQAKDGTYVNALLGASFSIKDNILTDPEGVHRRLSAKTPTEFFIECLPETLCFFGDDTVKLCGQQIIPQWSETGTVYTRERDQRELL